MKLIFDCIFEGLNLGSDDFWAIFEVWNWPKTEMRAWNCGNGNFELLKSSKLISRKIWVAGKLWSFHTVDNAYEILREINFGYLRMSNNAILTIFKVLSLVKLKPGTSECNNMGIFEILCSQNWFHVKQTAEISKQTSKLQ